MTCITTNRCLADHDTHYHPTPNPRLLQDLPVNVLISGNLTSNSPVDTMIPLIATLVIYTRTFAAFTQLVGVLPGKSDLISTCLLGHNTQSEFSQGNITWVEMRVCGRQTEPYISVTPPCVSMEVQTGYSPEYRHCG